MSSRSRIRPAYLVALALAVPPAMKMAEWASRPGPKALKAEAVAAGKELFNHEWKVKDPLTGGDGIGPVFNARSCVECHGQAGAGGGGPVDKNVTVYGIPQADADARKIPPIGVVHFQAVKPGFQETLNMAHSSLPATPRIELERLVDRSARIPTGITVTQRNTPALWGNGLLDAIPEDSLYAAQRSNTAAARLVGFSRSKDPKIRGRVARLPDGRLGRFGWKAEFATLGEFVKAACANELGLSNPGRPQATPLARLDYKAPGEDLTEQQCEDMTDYIRALARPSEIKPADPALHATVERGRNLFNEVGCADCHTPSLGPISGFYSDLLMHDMGPDLSSATGYYGGPPPPDVPVDTPDGAPRPSSPGEWKTPPLWGAADSGPWLHDGRAETLEEAIAAHKGESSDVTSRFEHLSGGDQAALIEFLKTLKAPTPKAQEEALRVASN